MRLRAFAVALLLPLGLLACGDDDAGLTIDPREELSGA